MSIRKLSALLINQIAAGEVIERPASVVKELVENSLDAGATRIDIAIEDGGRQLIRISDNGCGICESDLPLAITAHATSKLENAEQLAAIQTLGFRGEALASIASVSRLKLISRASDGAGRPAESGMVIEAAGEQVTDPRPIGTAPGSIVEVRDLFFNVPARRKFLRGASPEFGHINEIVQRIAMVHHAVGFTLTHNGRRVLELVGTQTRRRRCVDLLGKELDEALLETSFTDKPVGDMVLWALVGEPSIARATSKFQYLYVNDRPVRDRQMAHAVKEAYRGLIPPDRHPVAVVMVRMDPAAVDVNVHPAKSEVRFREPSRVHGLVLSTIRQRLLGADLTPKATFQPPPQQAGSSLPFQRGDHPVAGPGQTASSPMQGTSTESFVNFFRQMDPHQKGFVYQQVKEAYAADPRTLPVADPDKKSEVLDGPADADAVSHPDAWQQAQQNTQAARLEPPAVLREQGVLQVHQSYLVTQDEQGILIVDQHALHERVIFEQLRQRVLSQTLESQRLLMPATIRAGAGRLAALEQIRPLVEKIGIEADPLGPETIAVQAFPSLLFEKKVEPGAFLEELLDKAEQQPFDLSSDQAAEAALHEVLDMMACKAAVKAGDKLSAQELADLLARRQDVERSSNCPHGRPTTIRLTLRDLEKQFKRA